MNHLQNDMHVFDVSETYQATNSIQIRTHPAHSNINFSELGKKLLESARNGDVDEVAELISGGAPFTTDWLGSSPLHYAAQYGHVDTVQALLNAGIAKDARTKIERTPLHVAAQEGHLSTVGVLVQFGADVDAKDMLRMTPLHWAVQRGHREVMELLVEHGADVDLENKFEKNAIDIAYASGHQQFVSFLQNYVGRPNPKPNPVDQNITIKTNHKSNSKNRYIKPNILSRNQSTTPSVNTVTIKQEHDVNQSDEYNMTNSIDFLESIAKSNKKDPKDNNLLQNAISNGHSLALTEAGKMVLTNYKDQPASQSSSGQTMVSAKSGQMNKPVYTNFVILPNNQNANVKVVAKKPTGMYTELKTTPKTVATVNKLPVFQGKPAAQPSVIRRYVINQSGTIQLRDPKDDEIKKLQEETKKLKKEIEDYKELIIAKDLEIEKLKKRLNSNSNGTGDSQ